MLDLLEFLLRAVAAVAGLATLAVALFAIGRALRMPSGREEPGARIALSAPMLVLFTVAFFLGGVLLWQPLPLVPSPPIRAVLLLVGSASFFGGLSLYLGGMRSLGGMFAPSSGFGVRLHVAHRLVTTGPYARIRHPMYVGVILAALGTLFLYLTWAALVFAVIMFGLIFRARREEKVLAQEFGSAWAAYAARVPPWLPRLR